MGLAVAALGLCHCACGGAGPTTFGDPSANPSDAALALEAEPEPVTPGGIVSLTVRPPSPGGWEAAPPITIHLPPGAGKARAESVGWVCQAEASAGDAIQAEAHTDVACLTALAGRVPGLLLTFGAPVTAGPIRTCVTYGRPGRSAAPTCIESTVQ